MDTTILRVVLIFVSVLIILSLWGFYSSIRPPKIISSHTPRDLKMNYEDVSFKTADGLTLRGWYAPSRNGAAVVLVHGSGGSRLGPRRHARLLAEHGYGVPAYNMNNMEQGLAIMAAAEATRSPVILQASRGARAGRSGGN